MITPVDVDNAIVNTEMRHKMMAVTHIDRKGTRDRVVREIMEAGNSHIGMAIYRAINTELTTRFKQSPRE